MRGTFGTFDLRTPHDLLQKLRHDFDQLRQNPRNAYVAFNFFVTAEHMKDWVLPGYANRAARENLERASPLLPVCSHIANGAKHFVVEAPHHRSVRDTRRAGGHWAIGHWPARAWALGHWGRGVLFIELEEGDAKKLLGPKISAVDLAERVVAFWENLLASTS